MSTHKSTVNVDDEVMSETPTEEGGGGETPRSRSNVWKNFTRIGKDEEGYERATCNNCSHAYKVGRNPVSGQNYGTSHLTRHTCKGSSYSTSSLYFMEVWKIQSLLEANQSSNDSVIKEMSMRMKTKFDKYWTNYSVVLAFGAILDPRLKVAFLTYCYEALDPSTRLEKVKHVTDKFDKLYEEYATNYTNSNTSLSQSFIDSTSSSISNGERTKPKRAKIGFNQFLSETSSPFGKSEIEVYLKEPKIDLDEEHPEEYDVLQYWKVNEKKYPILSIMARDILCIPITTVASESAFSIGGRVLTKYRSSTLPEHIQMLICTRNWLHGYVENPSDEEFMCAKEEFEFDVHDVDLH